MGWLYTYKPANVSAADFIARENRTWWDKFVIAHATAREGVFVLMRHRADLCEPEQWARLCKWYVPNDKGEILGIAVWLIRNDPRASDGYNFGRKDMDELSGPCINGPVSLIRRASELCHVESTQYARDWRARSLAAAESTNKLRKELTPGATVRFPEPVKFQDGHAATEFTVERCRVRGRRGMATVFRARDNGRLYGIARRLLANATIEHAA